MVHPASAHLRAKLQEVKAEVRRRRHAPIPETGEWLGAVVRGHCQYYGIIGNSKAIQRFRDKVSRLWHRALSQRSQKGWVRGERMHRLTQRWLPPARVVYTPSAVALAVMMQGKSPVRCALGKLVSACR